MAWVDSLIERHLIPDVMMRAFMRHLNARTLQRQAKGSVEEQQQRFMAVITELLRSPVAIACSSDEQLYEWPASFFKIVLGAHLKYSCGYWDGGVSGLDHAEERMLRMTTERALIRDGQEILDLGCGWGSLAFYIAEKFPKCSITAVSDSHAQTTYITDEAKKRGMANITAMRTNAGDLQFDKKFDRIVSVEMFEHVRNYRKLFHKLSGLLKPEGKLFVHIFAHKQYAYTFEAHHDYDWVARHFFTGCVMPSDSLLLYFSDDFRILDQWRVCGTHYEKTCNAWLANLARRKKELIALFNDEFGEKQAQHLFTYWRMFFMASAELFGYRQGQEWGVSHYLFEKI
ncbi:MAG: class I SAM-dependent methyltransferase [Candidatus Auribacterota bacterium]